MGKRSKLNRAPVSVSGRRCAIYSRFSTEMQAEQGFTSCEAQENVCRAYIEENGGQLVEVYREEAKTGTNLNRKQWKRLLADAQARKFDVVVVTFMARLGRGEEFIIARYELENARAQVVTVKESFASGLAGYAHQSMMIATDGLWPRIISEQTRTKLAEMVRMGLWPGGPSVAFGYKAIEDERYQAPGKKAPKRLVPDSEQVELVREAFAEFLATDSIAAVRDLLAEGTGEPWTDKRARQVLANPICTGSFVWAEITNESFCAPIVSKDVFAQAQVLLSRRGRGQKRPNPRKATLAQEGDTFSFLLTGRIRCSCGGNMTPYWSQSKGMRYHYYQCHRTRAAACPTGQVSASWLHETLISEIKGFAAHPSRVRQLLEAASAEIPDLGDLTRQLIAARRESKRLASQVDRLTQALTLSTSDGAMRSVLSALESVSGQRTHAQETVTRLEEQIEAARQSKPTASHFSALMSRFSELWEAATPQEQEVLLKAFIVDIEIQGKKEFRVQVLSDFSMQAKITKNQSRNETGQVGVSENNPLSAPESRDALNLRFPDALIFPDSGPTVSWCYPLPARGQSRASSS